MGSVEAFLREWFVEYVKHRDIMTRSIKEIKDDAAGEFTVTYTNKVLKAFMIPDLHGLEVILPRIKDDCNTSIVTLSNPENIDALFHAWKKVVPHSKLNFFFVNPFSSMEKRWIIFPSTHDSICDSSSLKTGIIAMAELVEPISLEEAKRRM